MGTHTNLGAQTSAHMSAHASLGALMTAHTNTQTSFEAHMSSHMSVHTILGAHTIAHTIVRMCAFSPQEPTSKDVTIVLIVKKNCHAFIFNRQYP